MSSSIPRPKFLLDENVRVELVKFLKSQGFDVKLAPKAAPDLLLASLSKKEKRILVTNDEDFVEYTDNMVFSIVWLRIPQNDPKKLIASFQKLLSEFNNFRGKLIVLETGRWQDFPLAALLDSP